MKKIVSCLIGIISILVIILANDAEAGRRGGVEWGMGIGPGGFSIGIGSRGVMRLGFVNPGMMYAAPPVMYQQPQVQMVNTAPAVLQGGGCFPQGVILPNGAYVYRWSMGQQFQMYIDPGEYPPGTCF